MRSPVVSKVSALLPEQAKVDVLSVVPVCVHPVTVAVFQLEVLLTGNVACPQLNKLVKNAKKNNFVFIIFKNIVCKI